MKRIMPFYLYPHYLKTAGLLLSVAGIAILTLINVDFQVAYYIGLICIVFSKEKIENDLSKDIRGESFKYILGLFLSLYLIWYLLGLINNKVLLPCHPFVLIGLPLNLYIFFFNLLLTVNKNSEEEKRNQANKKYLFWMLFAVANMLGLSLFFY